MIISNSRKFIYLRVPRTGSTSLSNFLIANLAFDPAVDVHSPLPYNRLPGLNFSDASQVHANLADILRLGLLRHPLADYAVFAVVRDPVDRFISAAWHACHYDRVAARDNDEAVAYALRVAKPTTTVFRPQCDWLVHAGRPVNRIFPYGRIDALAQAVLGIADATVGFQHRSESRRTRDSRLEDRLRRTILARYAADGALYAAVAAGDPGPADAPSAGATGDPPAG